MTASDHDSTQLNTVPISVSKSTWVPRQKVTAGGIAGAFVTCIVILLNNYVITGDRPKLPAEFSSAATVLLSFAAAYLVPPDPRERSIGTGTNARSALEE